MSAAHVHPGDFRAHEDVAEFSLEGLEGGFEIPGALFAKGVEMKPGNTGEIHRRECGGGDTEA